MPYEQLDADRIQVQPLAKRHSYIDIEQAALSPASAPGLPAAFGASGASETSGGLPQIEQLAQRMRDARKRGASVMLAYGAHLIKNGAGPLVAALVEGGWVTHLATQGAGVIHDWEFAYLGRSSESVRDNTPTGRFGTWDETGRWLNLAALVGACEGMGFGEAVGRLVVDEGLTLPEPGELAQQIQDDPGHALTGARADLLYVMRHAKLKATWYDVPHRWQRYTILASSYTHRVPLTVHPGIGYDIFTNHPLFHGGAIGRTSGTDTRIFAHGVSNLTGGVYLSIGSAIMSPQVFEKALSLANNVRQAAGKPAVSDHYMAVVDIQDGGGWDWSQGEPPKDHPAYYLRFCKTFHRMGGTLDYLCGDNRVVLAHLVKKLKVE